MSDQQQASTEKKPSKGTQILAWILILFVLAGVWQCVTGGGSSSSSSSNSAAVDKAVEDFKNSPAARISSYPEAVNFVIDLRTKGFGMGEIDPIVDLLRKAGKNEAARFLQKANRDVGD